MPTYEYKCKNGHEHLETRSILESQKQEKCDICKSKLYQVYGKMAISFNGDGFYTTDKKKRD